MQEVDDTVFEPILKKILFAVQDVAKEQKYDIVLRGEAVLYGATATDITDDVINRLKEDASPVGTIMPKAGKGETDTVKAAKPESTPANKASDTPAAKPDVVPQTSEPSKAVPSVKLPFRSTIMRSSEQKSAGTSVPVRPVDRQPE
jgi:hypothetical protein